MKFKFRRQQPIGSYIADFFCSDAGLIVELDGSQHGEPENQEKDEKRTAFLESRGYKVLRFWNRDLIENMDGVLETIFSVVSEGGEIPQIETPSAASLSLKGRGGY
jgi:very-short-patch-repair endonuclease